MKTINYTGSSKLISRIVNLLNRKAPLPLDGDGNPDWGTNGQVLSTDGNGNTAWVNQGGGGSGGHTIENTSGTDLPQEDNLQFVGVYTRDDSVNNRTEVNIVRQMTKAAMQALSSAEKEGFIDTTDEDDDYIPISAEDVKRGVSDVDADLTALENGKVNRSGDTMTGALTIQNVSDAIILKRNNNAYSGWIGFYNNYGLLGYYGMGTGGKPLFIDIDGNIHQLLYKGDGASFSPTTFTNTSFTPTDNTRTTLYTNTSGHSQLVFCSVSAEVRSATGIIYLNKNNDGNNPLATAQLSAVDVTNPQYQHVTLTCFVSLANGDAIKYYPVTSGGTLKSHSVVLAY